MAAAGLSDAVRVSVGLEVHVRLRTPTKLFCGCPNRAGDAPNTLVCPVCLGLPGTLPVLQPEAADAGWRVALALGCVVAPVSVFARKTYFYPDLPRNFQITQYDRPLATGGALAAVGRRVRLRRLHLEEDAGRIAGTPDGRAGVDLNRAGAPLLELVTEPDLNDGPGAAAWLRRLRQVLLYLGVTDGRMAAGSLRCDANVGLAGTGALVELKNLNSFRAVERAVAVESARLTAAAATGAAPAPETRAWDDRRGRTRRLRLKETSADYRYLPEPDLPPLALSPVRRAALAADLPVLPEARERALRERWGLGAAQSATLARLPGRADHFEQVAGALAAARPGRDAAVGALAATWLLTEVLGDAAATDDGGERYPVAPGPTARLLALVLDGRVTRRVAKDLHARLAAGALDDPAAAVAREGLDRVDDEGALAGWCAEALAAHPSERAAWRGGKEGLLEFFVGRVMAASGGRADPRAVRRLLLRARDRDDVLGS